METKNIRSECPDENIKFVIGAPEYYLIIKDGADKIYFSAVRKYGENKVVALFKENATLINYKNYLSCKHLDAFFHVGSEYSGDGYEPGQAFMLYGEEVLSYRFFEQGGLDYQQTAIVFDVCRAFKDTTPGFCQAITRLKPKIYSSGVTTLLIYGSVETYTCFWQQVLDNNAPLAKTTLDQCAKKYDPSVEGSEAGLYLVASAEYPVTVAVNTTATTYYFNTSNNTQADSGFSSLGHLVLRLAPTESIQNISFVQTNQTLITTCPSNTELFGVPGIQAAEFTLSLSTSYDKGSTCFINNINYERPDNAAHDIYGFYPEDKCLSCVLTLWDQMSALLPEELIIHFTNACTHSALFTFVSTLTEEVLRYYYQCNDSQVHLAGCFAKGLIILLSGSWFEAVAASSGQWLINWLNFSQKTAQLVGSGIGYSVHFYNNFTNPIKLFSAISGNYIGSHVGFWAAKKVIQRIRDKSIEQLPSLKTAVSA